jgi:hypothetical protein
MMQKIRNALADILVGIVVVVVAFWLLRGVFRLVIWGATIVMLGIIVVFVLRVAAKLRG